MKKILIVDDNEANRTLIRDILTMKKYMVFETHNGRQVLNLAPTLKPDLILMDIQLPIMDGITATRKLKEDPATRDIPVVAISGYTLESDKQAFFAAGGQSFLCKPIHIDELEKVVADTLGYKP
jgi:two-component system cell cycle response regulator DivK